MITREFLKSTELFAGMDDGDLGVLAGLAREEVFPKGQAIFREREPGGKIYIVLAGVVEILKAVAGSPRSHCLARLGRGEVLGEVSAFDQGPRSGTAQAAVVPETRVASWGPEPFHRFLAERPRAATVLQAALLRRMGARLRQTSDALHLLLRALEGATA